VCGTIDDSGDGGMGDDGRTKTRNERKHHRTFLDFHFLLISLEILFLSDNCRQNDKLLRYYYLQQRC